MPAEAQQAPPTLQTGGMQGLCNVPQQTLKNELHLLQNKNDVKCEISSQYGSPQYGLKSDIQNIQTEVLNHSLSNIKMDVQSAGSPLRHNDDDTRSSPIGHHVSQDSIGRNSPSKRNSPLQRHNLR